MAKRQSRKSISVRGVTYNQLREYCARINLSMSDFIEQRVADFFTANSVTFTMPGTTPKPATRVIPKPAPRPLRAPMPARPAAPPVSAPHLSGAVAPTVGAPEPAAIERQHPAGCACDPVCAALTGQRPAERQALPLSLRQSPPQPSTPVVKRAEPPANDDPAKSGRAPAKHPGTTRDPGDVVKF